MASPLEDYLSDLYRTHATGMAVPETSYYPALSNLINAAGSSLKPRVFCIINLANRGAGLPDGGLFEQRTRQSLEADSMLRGTLPERGAVEVKSPGVDIAELARGSQVRSYLRRYGIVLATNLREFALVGSATDGSAYILESFRLAGSEEELRQLTASAREAAGFHGPRFVDFLQRVMQYRAPLSAPRDLAWFLASYARDARLQIEHAEAPALHSIRASLEEALGLKFEGLRGDHFFKSTLVQTLFYGVFSAWVLWHKRRPHGAVEPFQWRSSAWELHVPMIRALFWQVSNPAQLGALGLVEIMDRAGDVLNRVESTFFDSFEESHAVQYFYEPFLQEFDPELRKQLGVWYTPPEIVEYMVSRVDTVLREELNLPDGLADPNVVVLDPCCGTGAYLVEVLRRIARNLQNRGEDSLVAAETKRAATTRVFGFEILPAPFVVAHLQLGLMLENLGAPLRFGAGEDGERAGVYLTNALTGWETPEGPQKRIDYPELEAERDAAGRVKRDERVLVVIGNPPYNGFAGVAVAEERDLSNAYRSTEIAAAPHGQGLNDLYIRFYRVAERRIVEMTGRGIVCFISNYSWLDGLSFTGMREHYLNVFDKIWVDNLHGNRIISEYAPDGRTSETIFAMGGDSPGIRIGTAIGLLVKSGRQHESGHTSQIRFTDCSEARASDRRRALLDSLTAGAGMREEVLLEPEPILGLPFTPTRSSRDYFAWPLLTELMPQSYPGVKTSRDDALVAVDRATLEARIRTYFDASVPFHHLTPILPSLTRTTKRFDAQAARARLLARGLGAGAITRYAYRPFDVRWLYWEPETKLLDEKREDYAGQIHEDNLWIEARQKQPMARFDRGYVTRRLADNMGNGLSSFFPMYIAESGLFSPASADQARPNISTDAVRYLADMASSQRPMFFHSVAILHTPSYREDNRSALRQDWPRIPLPKSRQLLVSSAALGERIAALLDTETPVNGVTTGPIMPPLRAIGAIARDDGRQLDPGSADFAVTARWGYAGQGSVTMPGPGRAKLRDYTSHERSAIGEDAAVLGEQAVDVYLNDNAAWRCVPQNVWQYTVGGYQVMKKWLSYREMALLGRALTLDEVREVTNMARRIAAILLLHPQLDASYTAVKGEQFDWQSLVSNRGA